MKEHGMPSPETGLDELQTNRNGKLKSLAKKAKPYILSTIAAAALLPAAACGDSKPDKPRALFIDPLSATDPASASVLNSLITFEQNGYDKGYICSQSAYIPFLEGGKCKQDAYVEEFKYLPKYEADIIIIRAHSYSKTTNSQTLVNNEVGLFTSQPYEQSLYLDDQRNGNLGIGRFYDREAGPFFSIGPNFVKNEMVGEFKKGTMIITTGCDSLSNASLSQAFFDKGVETYFGWSGPVSSEHTDKATAVLVDHLIVDKMSPQDALMATFNEVGPDPYYDGVLLLIENTKNDKLD